LREEKAVEVGNIFKLKTKFSDSFDLKYTDSAGEKKSILMGCYGIGLQRLMGTIVEATSDEQGMIWPDEVAPFTVHLISLNKNKEANKIYEDLVEAGIEVLYDDRDEASAGEKFKDADLIGCPYRVVVSEKTLAENSVEIKNRSEEKAELIKINKLIKKFE
jgi:prolyl-tRNA synthetase